MNDAVKTEGLYKVPESNLASLQVEIAKLNRKASKLGLEPITMEILGSEDRAYAVSTVENRRRVATPEDLQAFKSPNNIIHAKWQLVYFKYMEIKLVGRRPRLDGWDFVATLQHLEDENGVPMNLLRIVPGFKDQLPTQYRTASPQNCDHCQRSIKTRKETFLVRHDDGAWKQIGRNCTQDFLGNKDPHAVIAEMEAWLRIDELCAATDESDYGVGHGEYRFDIEQFLAVTAAMIRVDGWCSRAKARQSEGL